MNGYVCNMYYGYMILFSDNEKRDLVHRVLIYAVLHRFYEHEFLQVADGIIKRWNTFSSSKEHILVRQYMLAGALKAIMQTSFGEYFKSDKQIVEFEDAYDIVSKFL